MSEKPQLTPTGLFIVVACVAAMVAAASVIRFAVGGEGLLWSMGVGAIGGALGGGIGFAITSALGMNKPR
ncbi:MAG: hypothetical protein AAGD32_16860 [Planctomycetota bacterium]